MSNLPLKKPTKSDLVPKYMSREAYEFGKKFTKIKYTEPSLTEAQIIEKINIPAAKAVDLMSDWMWGSFNYVNDNVKVQKQRKND